VFCALHDQLASLDRHVQLMRCFSAVAELVIFKHRFYGKSFTTFINATKFIKYNILKKLQRIYLMLYKQQIRNCKNQKYKHELYALAYIFIWLI